MHRLSNRHETTLPLINSSIAIMIGVVALVGVAPNRLISQTNLNTVNQKAASQTALSFTNISFSSGIGRPGELGGHSAIFGDLDGDDFSDLYITMLFTGGMSDLFFHNMGNLHFSEEGTARGINDFDGGSHGACYGDLDNDGDLDLVNGTTYDLTGKPGVNNIYYNDGKGYFTELTDTSKIKLKALFTRGLTVFDMEGDGDLDIFCVTNYLGTADPPGEINELYRNEGNLQFTSIDSGVLVTSPAAQGVTATDYDGDGDLDIFTGNRTGPVNILNNDGRGNFTIIDPGTIGIQHWGRESVSTADVDNDGDLDLLLFGSVDSVASYLYLNSGDGSFIYQKTFSNINGYMGGFADLDNDTDVDLVFAGDDLCYLNDGLGNFSQGPAISVDGVNDPRAIGFADIDNDGDLDFAVGCKRSHNFLIQNNYNAGNWLKVKLLTKDGQVGAFGAKVHIYQADQQYSELICMREAQGAYGYLGQNDPLLHFGLGDNQVVDVVVNFLDGTIIRKTEVAANQTCSINLEDFALSVEVPVILDGPTSGILGQRLSYRLDEVSGINCDEIDYQFDWGDNTLSDWGTNVQEHIYFVRGKFEIKARARGSAIHRMVISDWSNILSITIRGFFLSAISEPAEGGEITKNPDKSEYAYQDTVEIIAQPNPDFEFDKWSGDLASTQSSLFLVMMKDKNITAQFQKIAEILTNPMAPSGVDSTFLGKSEFFATGNSVSNLRHEIAYQFDWGDEVFSDWGDSSKEHFYFKSNSYALKARARCKIHHEVVSDWSAIHLVKTRGLHLSATVDPPEAGFIEIRPAKNEFVYLDTVVLKPVNLLGYYFSFWSGNLTGSDSLGNLVFDSDKKVTANFDKILETVSPPQVVAGPDSGILGKRLRFSANGASSNLHHELVYQFDWGDGRLSAWGEKIQENVYALSGFFQIKARVRCKAHGEINSDWSNLHPVKIYGLKLAVTVNPIDGGEVNAEPLKTEYAYMDSVILTPVPALEYQFECWSGDLDGAQAPGILLMDTTKEVMAGFEKITETIATPELPTGPQKGFRKQGLIFSADGATTNLKHKTEYQFFWGDGDVSFWGDSLQSHVFNWSGEFLVRSRARCQSDTAIVSEWSNNLDVCIVGCCLNINIEPEGSGKVSIDPQSLDYDYGTKVILSAKELDGFLFKFWNDDKEDTSPNKDFIIKNDTTVVANFARVSNVEKLNEGIPAKFYLMQNYPNPFNAQAIIRYGVAKDSNVKISIFNLQGQKLVTLVNDYHKAGAYVIDWDCSHHAGESFTSGIYVYLMEAQNHHKEIKKMTIIR